jgi:hypothetical protein
LENLFLNPHLIPFKISFIIGALFIGIVPFNYMRRTGHPITNLAGLANYSKSEWKALVVGVLFLFIGMIGSSAMKDKYGFNVKVTDINGVVHIENTKTW